MRKIKVEVKSLNIIQQIDVYLDQKGVNILQILFNKLDFNQEIRKSIQSTLKVENVEVDINQTINALDINNYSLIEVILSKKIIIECDHKYLGSIIKYNTNAFTSVNQFRNYLIKDLIKINSCQIVIINKENGNQLEGEAWGKYGIFKDIKVGLQFTKQQKISFNQIIQEITIDIFQPIAKIIREYMNTFNINDDIITFKINKEYINPDEVYKNLNLSPEQSWNAEISEDFTFRISFEQQGIKKITIHKDKDVFDLIRIVRESFKIENTIPLKLEYKLTNYILEMNNTIKQECIPSYSNLNLIREPSDNSINILLFNQQTMYKQIHRVDISLTLAHLDQFITNQENNDRISYYVENQVKVKTFNLKQLDLKSESIIQYEIEEKEKSLNENISKKISELHQPSDELPQISQNDGLLTIKFENKYTNKSDQITIKSSTIVSEALKEVIKNEIIKDPNYYNILLNDEKIDKNVRLDSLKIVQNQTLIYFTELVVFQGFVEQQIYTLVVDQNLPLYQIEEQFRKQHNINSSLSLQLINSESKNESLKQFLIKNQNFKFQFKIVQVILDNPKQQIKQLSFYILLKELDQQFQFQVNKDEICLALFDSIKSRCNLAKNQVIKVFVGDRLIDQNETVISIYNLINQTKKQLTVEFIYFLTLIFENTILKQKKIKQAKLEDTLEQVLLNNKIYGQKFYYQKKSLDIKKKIKYLPIENDAIIQYQSNLMIFENNRTGQEYKVDVQPEDTLQILIDRLRVKINKIYYQNEILDQSIKIKNIDLSSGENIMFDELETLHEASENFSQIIKDIKVIVSIGGINLTYEVNLNVSIGFIKQIVFNNILKDQGVDIDKYSMIHNEIKLNDQQPLSNICKGHQIELKLQLSS